MVLAGKLQGRHGAKTHSPSGGQGPLIDDPGDVASDQVSVAVGLDSDCTEVLREEQPAPTPEQAGYDLPGRVPEGIVPAGGEHRPLRSDGVEKRIRRGIPAAVVRGLQQEAPGVVLP